MKGSSAFISRVKQSKKYVIWLVQLTRHIRTFSNLKSVLKMLLVECCVLITLRMKSNYTDIVVVVDVMVVVAIVTVFVVVVVAVIHRC